MLLTQKMLLYNTDIIQDHECLDDDPVMCYVALLLLQTACGFGSTSAPMDDPTVNLHFPKTVYEVKSHPCSSTSSHLNAVVLYLRTAALIILAVFCSSQDSDLKCILHDQ